MIDPSYFFLLNCFLKKALEDGRLGALHISLYLAILRHSSGNDLMNPVRAFARELMPAAKISAQATYHKCLKALHDYGYINYLPSRNRFVPSSIEILFIGCDRENGRDKTMSAIQQE